ncbi:hypothetical protein BJX64DRAFT_295301 [Aspergillus heterothallicus]
MAKNIRTYSSRTKTGCLTCRRRRVKCDEAKPLCTRCTRSNRACEGYTAAAAAQTKAAVSRGAPLRVIMYTPTAPSAPRAEPEKASFAFFLAQGAACFPADFARGILQAAQVDRVFTDAIVALGAAQQMYEFGEDDRARLGNVAMVAYGRALRRLRGLGAGAEGEGEVHLRGRGSVEVLLLCCVLFACFESLRGCRRSAVVHIKCGLDVLRQSERGSQGRWALVSRETMAAMFTRLDNQIVELLGVSFYETMDENSSDKVYFPGPISVKLPTSDLRTSVDMHLNHLFHRQLRLALVAGGRLPSDENSPAEAETPVSVKRQQVLFKTEALDTELLQIWQLMAELYELVGPGMGPEEAWDPYVEEFGVIVALSEKYLSQERPRTQKRIFGFSIGVIPPLYMTATRCRDPHIRRQAIRLLAEYPRREVMWDSTVAAEVARKVMEIEEGISDSDSKCGLDEAVLYKPARVRTVTAVLDDEDGARFEFVQQ